MTNPEMTLLSTALAAAAQVLAGDPANEGAWSDARAALDHYGVGPDADSELCAAVEAKDARQLARILAEWESGARLMLVRDRDVLKRALKAYRKRMKVTLLEAESSLAGGPMSAGRKSSIVGIVPPERYPREVWDELVRQKRLLRGDRGTYELAPGG